MMTPSSRSTAPFARWLPVLVVVSLLVSPLALFVRPRIASAALPSGFSQTDVASASAPTAFAFLPDGRMLITQKGGQLLLFNNGSTSTAFDISGRVCSDFERGLLGVAVDPNFAGNGFIYLYYTFNKHGQCPELQSGENPNTSPVNRVSRFTLSGSETVLLDNIPSPAGNHNAGDLEFGNDGLLYVTVGDGGCDYLGNSGCGGQNDASRDSNVLSGKVLRITGSGGIPGGNPYAASGNSCAANGRTTAGAQCKETFAQGFRNPFRLAINRNPGSGQIYVNDVGQNAFEEIDNLQAGLDYGWNCREGFSDNPGRDGCDDPLNTLTNPIFDYGRSDGCVSITGGAFVPNGLWPSTYEGGYLFGDYGCGKIFMLKGTTRTDFQTSAGGVVHLEFGPFGSSGGQALYYADINAGKIRRVVYSASGNQPPVADAQADPTFGPLPLDVDFDGTGSTDPNSGDTLTYEWNFGDGSPTESGAQVDHRYNTQGVYTATLTVRDGHGGTDTDTVRIDAGNTPPTPQIQSPTTSARFTVGQTITLTGSATDTQDGNLPNSALTWEVVLHHASHTHPFFPPTVGNNLTFTAPAPEDLLAATNSYLEVKLTAKDSTGLTTTISQNLLPKTVALTFATNPSGLNLQVNGTTVTGPQTVTSWQGYVLNVNAPSQLSGSDSYDFVSWSDGGAAAHQITTPASPTTYTATFQTSPNGILPLADARVVQASPDTNFGSSTALVVTGGSNSTTTFLKFDTGDLTGNVVRATLWLYCYSGTSDGPAVYTSLDTSWSESGITWNNRPARQPGAVDDRGAISRNTWVAYDVTARVTGEGTYTFVLVSSTGSVSFRSKEFGSFAPRLVIQTGTGDTQPPSTPSGLTGVVPANQTLRVDLRWNAATDNVGVTGYEIYRNGNLLQTVGAQTTFSDTAVEGGASYAYRIRAVDAAGNRSPYSSTVTVNVPETPPVGTVIVPNKDARVQEASPTSNYGTSTQLKAEGGSDPDVESYLRFTVGSVGNLQDARLRVFVTDGSSDGPAVYTASSSWLEGTITWNTRPARSGSPVADLGAIATGTWIEYNVSSIVKGAGTYTFVLATGSTDASTFSSREGANPPQLVLTVGAGPSAAESLPTPTPTATATATATPIGTPTATASAETPTVEATQPTAWHPFSDGFETGDLAAWTESKGLGVGADPTRGSLVTVAARSGDEVDVDATGAFARKDLAPPQAELYVHVAVNRQSQDTNPVVLFALGNEAGGIAFSLALAGDGTLVLVDAAGNAVPSWVKLTEPGWHDLQLHLRVDPAGGPGLVELWVDGRLVHQANATLGAALLNAFILGDPTFQPGRAYALAFDDVAIDIACIGSCPTDLVTPTPTATESSAPTATAESTSTPEPTLAPTEPPVPTETPVPLPTDTPVPLPTDTPIPPPPTDTPVPSPTEPPPPTETP